MAALRLGIVGFGRLARQYYVPALRTLPDVVLAAVADPLLGSRAAALAHVPRERVHEDHRVMLACDDLDGLLVASPPSTHLGVLDDAAASGRAVFVEKPLVLSEQLADLERRPPCARVMLDFNRRFWAPYRHIEALVRSGTLGRPIEADFLLHVDVLAWSTVTRHRLAPDEGGVLHDLGSQGIDVAMGLVGAEPRTIDAETRSSRWPDDHVRLRLEFPDGSVVRCDLAYAGRTRERLAVRGPAGRVRLDDPNLAVHADRESVLAARGRDLATLASRAVAPARAFGRASIRAALAHFVDALRGDAPFAPGIDDGIRNARWVAAAAAGRRAA
jgi:predicted dehydrogenase